MANRYPCKIAYDLIEQWCQTNGWTDIFFEHYRYWAFPPHAVMPLPVPIQSSADLRPRELSPLARRLNALAIFVALAAIPLSYFSQSPMPLVFAFLAGAIAVGLQDEEDPCEVHL